MKTRLKVQVLPRRRPRSRSIRVTGDSLIYTFEDRVAKSDYTVGVGRGWVELVDEHGTYLAPYQNWYMDRFQKAGFVGSNPTGATEGWQSPAECAILER